MIQKDIAGQDVPIKVMNVMFIRKKLNNWVQKWISARICFKDFPDFTLYLEVCAICQELTELCVSSLYLFHFLKWTYGRSFLWPYGWVVLTVCNWCCSSFNAKTPWIVWLKSCPTMGTMEFLHRLLLVCLNIFFCFSGLLWEAPVDSMDLPCG